MIDSNNNGVLELSLVEDEPTTTRFLQDDEPYSGPERRLLTSSERRQCRDRREEPRFETGGKAERRSGRDRRKGGWSTAASI